MPDQIQAQHSAAAANLYAVIRKPDGTVWNGSSFGTYSTVSLSSYALAMTEQGTASRYYAVNIPALAAGTYMVTVFVRAGGSPAETDSIVGTGRLEWDGSAELPLSGVDDAVWAVGTRTLTAGTNIVLAKGTGVTGFNDLSAAQVNAEADTALADVGLTTTITGRIDVATSTRLASAGYTAPDSASTIATAVWAAADRQLTAFSASFKAGYALSSAGVQAIWDALTSALTTVGSIGKLLVDNVNAAVGSRAAAGDAMTLTAGERNAIADAHLDRADAIEAGLTPRQAHRLEAAGAAGKLSGAGTGTELIRNAVADSKVRITATVDEDGNRTAITTDVT